MFKLATLILLAAPLKACRAGPSIVPLELFDLRATQRSKSRGA